MLKLDCIPWKSPIQVNLASLQWSHHYIKGHISVFGRGFICFCCLEPNFLHGVSCPYCPEYWRVSSVIPQKNWGVWTHFFNFWPFLLVGKATSLWQKLHWDSLWMQLFFLKPLQFKRLWVVPSWHEWGTHCAKTGLNPHPQSHNVMDACWISTQIVGFPTIL